MNVWNDRKGMTLVELIVAFSILMLTLSMFTACLAASSRVLLRIRTAQNRLQEFRREYYLRELEMWEVEESVPVMLEFVEREGDGRFSISVIRRKIRLESGVFYDVELEGAE